MSSSTHSVRISAGVKAKAYYELLKPRLSFLVAFSSAFGFLLGSGARMDFATLGILFVGGFLVSGASVTLNQILERNYDAIMTRTMHRPLPSARINPSEAMVFASITGGIGLLLLLLFTNELTAILSLVSLLLYAFVYTPLKRVGPIAVFVGAIPGALPPLLGWVAATGVIDYQALIIFGIQFIWQFPHFWAIAWIAHEDYSKAGFRLLPSKGEKDISSAVQIMTYTLFLIPLGLLPAKFGITGINSALVVTICGVLFLSQTFRLIKDSLLGVEDTSGSARRIMFGSFLYLPVVQIAFVLDKV